MIVIIIRQETLMDAKLMGESGISNRSFHSLISLHKVFTNYCGRQHNSPSKIFTSYPGTWEHVSLHGERNFADVINELDMGLYPGGNYKGPYKQKRGRRVGEGDVKMLLFWLWRWEEGPWTKERRWSTEVGKIKDTDPCLEPPVVIRPCQNSDVRSVTSRTLLTSRTIVVLL